MKYFLLIATLTAPPAFSQEDLSQTASADLVAEIEFLEGYARPPKRFANTEERALQDYFASYAICEEMSFNEYTVFVDEASRSFDQEVILALGQRSYQGRAESGCDIDEDALSVIVGYVEYQDRVSVVFEAIAARRAEMLRRTLLIQN